MPIYRTAGSLIRAIEPQNVAKAQEYLTVDDMTPYLPANVGPVEHIEWTLSGNGYDWTVTAFAICQLTPQELAELGSWVHGQNSDGLGENFEQQEFAEFYERNAYGDIIEDTYEMASFDWETNSCVFTRVK